MRLFDSLPGERHQLISRLHPRRWRGAAPATEDMLRNWRGKVVHTGGLLALVDDTLGRLEHAGCAWGKR